MEKLYFVMINNQDGTLIMPMVDTEDQQVALFDTPWEAREAAQGNRMATAFGYEIFERGNGDQ